MSNYLVQEKELPNLCIAGIRTKGRYADCGKVFGKLCSKLFFRIGGKPMMLTYDTQFRETDADFEPCFPVKPGKSVDGIDIRDIPGGRFFTLVHKGPYDQLHSAYSQLFETIKTKGLVQKTPGREVYLKGPGMLFRGNPKNYLTEVQIGVEEPSLG